MTNQPELFPIKMRVAIKTMTKKDETGERTIVLSLPPSEAGRFATLTMTDQIIFDVTFAPAEIGGEPQL